ncbi:carboxypeptidase-like regulatory domain-containing protein, partial [Bacteroidota bacterium]
MIHCSSIQINPKQTIRGRVLDIDSQTPLIGVNLILGSDDPVTGTITDVNGYFKFEGVPVGRHDLKISSVGYEPKYISKFLVGSGKELVMTIEMEESIVEISEVEITNSQDKSQPVNKLTLVSGRSFSSYEIENYPGSMSDISRAAVSLPGVLSTNDGQNHIVIRGNSPKGLQWRLEGIEIPNLNHFSNIGASGGGVGIISNNMISGSDFITSAFPAEYGNALSGVFDLRLRKGNSEKHEQTIQVGLIGTEVMIEGPLNKANNTTYIANYRYSTFKLIQKMGAPLRNVPDFQDLSFKIYHPTKKLGVFSIFGIGGLSHEEGVSGYIMNSNMSTVGVSNNLTINPKSFLKSTVAFSGWNYNWNEEWNIGTETYPIDEKSITDVKDFTLKGSIALNRKINPKHKVKIGLIYEMAFNDSYIGLFSDTLYNRFSNPVDPGYQTLNYEYVYTDANTHASTIQSFVNWKYRIGEKLTLNSGLHFIEYFLNNNYSIEPRLGLQWSVLQRHTFSAGFGIHSKKESMTLYTGTSLLPDGSLDQP